MAIPDPTGNQHPRDTADFSEHTAERGRRAVQADAQLLRWQLLGEEARDYATFLLDAKGHIVHWDEHAGRLLGYSAEEILHKPLTVLVADDIQGNAVGRELLTTAAAQGRAHVATELRRRDGTRCGARLVVRRLPAEVDPPVRFLVVLQDNMALQREETLLLRERQLRETQRVGRIGSWDWDIVTQQGAWTDELYRIYGVPPQQVPPKDVFFRLCHPADRDTVTQIVSQAMRDGQPFQYEHRIYRDDNRELRIVYGRGEAVCDDQGQPRRLFGTVQDITERKRLEAQLHQAHKMESIGRLAGGVAHDFNNLLTVINGCAELLRDKSHLDDNGQRLAAEIVQAGERAAALTKQLLAFSRQQVSSPRILDLNPVLRDAETLLRRLIGENIELVLDLEPALGRVRADRAQLEQVVINLAVNARDAMAGGGRLTIATRNVHIDPSFRMRHADSRPGSYVALSVTDTGCGMDEETKTHLFEPFFTTKEVGKGTGLGLATIYGIIKQSSGHIEVTSEPARGTTVQILLPHATEMERPNHEAQAATRAARGDETILLVEDEESVRNLARITLQMHGYRVLVANNGAEALAVYRNHKGPLHLLVTDLVMPRVGGRRLAAELTALLPSLRVLFVSGYAEGMTHEISQSEGSAFLQKPFTPNMLTQTVRQILDDAKGR